MPPMDCGQKPAKATSISAGHLWNVVVKGLVGQELETWDSRDWTLSSSPLAPNSLVATQGSRWGRLGAVPPW